MIADSVVNLGGDILLYDGADPSVVSQLHDRFRFMDVLWLPCGLAHLDELQIRIINRFREERIAEDPQFQHANRARRAVVDLLTLLNVKRVIEIGCGKFPLAPELKADSYRGIEIDEDAISACRQLNLDVRRLDAVELAGGPSFDICISLYVFHFAVSRDLIVYLADCLTETAPLIFNLIAHDAPEFIAMLELVGSRFPVTRVVKTPALATREFFVVASRENTGESAERAARELRALLSK